MPPIVERDLDVIFGEFHDREVVRAFIQAARAAKLTGTLYVGYPVLSVDDARVEFDAVLVSMDRGVIVFDLYDFNGATQNGNQVSTSVKARLEQRYAALYNKLNSFRDLRRGRQLIVSIVTVAIHPLADTFQEDEDTLLIGLDQLNRLPVLQSGDRLEQVAVEHLNAAIQRISNLRPVKKRENVTKSDSKGARIKAIEAQIANLDLWQKRGSIEYVNGPQRIRGLAGSGKTVVLALKAAYLHVKRPDWNIVVTFNTRSLYQQFEALITRFVFSQVGDEPDWEKLHVMHAWGGSDRAGIYSDAAKRIGATYRDFGTASRLFGYNQAFDGACQEALKQMTEPELDIYDMMLVDEAQDLPASFFRLAYRCLKDPKRIVWAYDDLQNLGDYRMPSEAELFGLGQDGRQLVNLKNENDEPQQDIVLPRSYRNPPWTLVTAHGVGFGVKHDPLIQIFPDPALWLRLGYRSADGRELQFDQDVSIERDPKSIPDFFAKYLTAKECLKVKCFEDRLAQYDAVAKEILRLITDDELQHSDMLIVLPDTMKSRAASARVMTALRNKGLQGHVPGVTSSRDEVFKDGSVAITHIHRAKGNEAPVVFVVDADYCEAPFEQKKRRNVLFTAITRSRAWTYVSGVGSSFAKIESEIRDIQAAEYQLKFHYPTQQAAQRLAASSDLPTLKESEDAILQDLRSVLRKTREQNIAWDDLPEDVKRDFADIYGPS